MNRTEAPSELEEAARALLPIVQHQARRAFVIELTGTPKAGKTTSVAVLKSFFEECGYRVHLLKERAADCPLPMKGHFFFNAWTTCTMIAEVLETVETDVDIMILDRGFFDALVWLELQRKRGQVTDDESRRFADFVLLDRWRSLVDVTVVVSVDPDEAMRRENANLLIRRVGSVMNPDALREFNRVLTDTKARYADQFRFLPFTSSGDIRASNESLIMTLMPQFAIWADPEIWAVPRAAVESIFASDKFLGADRAQSAVDALAGEAQRGKRSSFEGNKDFIQVVACGVPSHKDQLLVFKRSDKDEKSQRYGRHTLWKGCHVEATESPTLSHLAKSAARRIREDLHLVLTLEPKLAGIAWAQDDAHLGVIFDVDIKSEYAADAMKKKYRRGARQEALRGTFQNVETLNRMAKDENELEPWSLSYLQNHTAKRGGAV